MGFDGRGQSPEIQRHLETFVLSSSFKRRLKEVETKVGLGEIKTPIVTGSTAAAKTDSLIAALAQLGLIVDSTT